MIGGEPRDRIAGFWRALGVIPPPEPDHLATLLGAYVGLCEHGGVRARHAFLWEHLLSWLPAYLLAVRRQAPQPYPTWARLLLESLFDEARNVGGPVVLPLHLSEAPAFGDPLHGHVPKFLEALLTPARSGIILTCADLARAANTLDLGMRAGDRRLMLGSLLEQQAPATLAWIAREARAWQSLHGDLVPKIGPLAEHWGARASATAALLKTLEGELRSAVQAGAARRDNAFEALQPGQDGAR